MIIGISGKLRTGKTTLAEKLNPFLATWHQPHNFGDEVKEECSRLLGVPRSLFYSQEGKDLEAEAPVGVQVHFGLPAVEPVTMTLRDAMQKRGAKARSEEPGYWVYRLHERIHNLANVLIDDVRYPDEANYVRSRGGVVIRVNPHPYWEAGPYAEHESEIALDDWPRWDMELFPDFGALEAEARKVADFLKTKQ